MNTIGDGPADNILYAVDAAILQYADTLGQPLQSDARRVLAEIRRPVTVHGRVMSPARSLPPSDYIKVSYRPVQNYANNDVWFVVKYWPDHCTLFVDNSQATAHYADPTMFEKLELTLHKALRRREARFYVRVINNWAMQLKLLPDERVEEVITGLKQFITDQGITCPDTITTMGGVRRRLPQAARNQMEATDGATSD